MEELIVVLIQTIESKYLLRKEDYPVVAVLTEKHLFNFSISHSMKHIGKKIGVIAKAKLDGNDSEIEDALHSLIISCLKMAEILRLHSADITKDIQNDVVANKNEDQENFHKNYLLLLEDTGYIFSELEARDHGEDPHSNFEVMVRRCIVDVCNMAKAQGITIENFLKTAQTKV
jgi:hypothetical protein